MLPKIIKDLEKRKKKVAVVAIAATALSIGSLSYSFRNSPPIFEIRQRADKIAWRICKSDKFRKREPGIALSFDDTYNLNGWFEFFTREDIKKYGIKATFFVNDVSSLTDEEIRKLKVFESLGHDIGCHGFMHRKAP